MKSRLGVHPVSCLSYQIPLSLHLPALKTSLGPPRCFLRAGSPPAPLGEGCLLESSIPRLGHNKVGLALHEHRAVRV